MEIRLRLTAANVALASIYVLFASAHLQQFIAHPRLSVLLLVVMETSLVGLFLIRRNADRTWHSWHTWMTTTMGSVFPLLLRPAIDGGDLLAGQALQTVGAGLQIAAVCSLSTSMGLLPAHRGVKTNGLYRFVRHPLYTAHAIALLGYVISNWTWYNLSIFILGTAFQIGRIRNEELLLSSYAAYEKLKEKTRWRLVPFVW